MAKQRKPRKKTRRQYEFNWLQILRQIESAREIVKINGGESQVPQAITNLDDAIRGLRERLYGS